MDIEFALKFHDDFEYWKKCDRKISDKILRLVDETRHRPFSEIGKPESLKYELSGCWSRRINKEHRIVYRVSGDTTQFLSCRYHCFRNDNRSSS
ncbi:MAG: Txe/YoeB family addiction module toxin [Holosporales bacterium]|nr:Txe/YoeB family addiction module toxin [Holosporales bacterium]